MFLVLRVILKGNFFNGDSWDYLLFWSNGHPIFRSWRVAFKTGLSQTLQRSGFHFFLSVKWVVSLGFKHLLCTCVSCLAWASWVSWELLCFDLVFGVSLSSSDSNVLWCIDDISILSIISQVLFNFINPDLPSFFFSSVVGKKAKKNKWKTLDPTLIINTSALPVKPLSWAEESEIEGKRVLFFTFRVLGIFSIFF